MSATDSTSTETMVWFGGACKALDDAGKVGGYLVLFGSPDATDASPQRDYFTAETDFGLDLSTKARLLYHHGLVPPVGNRSLGIGELKADAVGIWIEGQLALRDEYEAKIFQMVKAGKLGLSSGTARHLIRREEQANGASKVVAWPLGLDASLTPAPAEPRTHAVAIKSLVPPEAKGLYLGERAEPAAMMAAHSSLAGRLQGAVWDHLGDEKSTPGDRMARIGAAHDEFKSLCMKCMKSLMGPGDGAEDDDAGAVKASLLAEDLRQFDRYMATLARLNGAIA
jgi:phage head maturation protease